MRIYIPTSGRPERQVTLASLPPGLATLVVPNGEADAYARANPTAHVLTFDGPRIMAKRNWILDHVTGDPNVLMLDDDLTFRRRGPDGRYVRTFDATDMLRDIELWLRQYAHVGICDEFMSQTNGPEPHVGAKRYNQVLAYNLGLFPSRAPRMRTEINEEHDLDLQLLEAGLPSCVLTEWTKSSKFYAGGGCSAWRTAEVETEGHRELARLHPGMVAVVPHRTSLSGLAVRVAWRKALAK